MARFVLALVAILVLALSAGINNSPFRSSPREQAAIAFGARQAMAAEFDFVMAHRPPQAPARSPASEEAPSPALLAYLALVLIGSAVAVAMVPRDQRRDF